MVMVRRRDWHQQRDATRERLAAEWRPILDQRGSDWDEATEQRRMWEAARHVAPDSTLSLDDFIAVDTTCMGHVDWLDKLTLRIAERITPIATVSTKKADR